MKGSALLGIGELQYSDVGIGIVLTVRAEVARFVLGAGVFTDVQVIAGCVVETGVDFFLVKFFSSSLFVSQLALLLLRFVVVSISSGCSTGGCCFIFSFFFFDTGDASVVIVVVTAVVSDDIFVGVALSGGLAVASTIVTLVASLTGDFSLLLSPLRVTWARLSSLLCYFCFL